MTWSPTRRSEEVISVNLPSLAPDVTASGDGRPSSNIHTCRSPVATAAGIAVFGGGPIPGGWGRRLSTKPPPPLADFVLNRVGESWITGVNRKAAFGTSNTSCRWVVLMVAAAVMPGRNDMSVLSTAKLATYVTTLSIVFDP